MRRDVQHAWQMHHDAKELTSVLEWLAYLKRQVEQALMFDISCKERCGSRIT
jgi:succinate dehydrogenase/fumarate reductase-like Fe-S protein